MKTHRSAVERSITAGRASGALDDRHAALVELCRVLAAQVDAAGPRGPSSRIAAAYLSSLKDLGRAIGAVQAQPRGGKLAELRAARGDSRSSAKPEGLPAQPRFGGR